jgi:hypothetical protein
MKKPRRNIWKQFHLQKPQKNQIPGSKLKNGCEGHLQGELQTPEERDQGRLQKTERSPVLMGW